MKWIINSPLVWVIEINQEKNLNERIWKFTDWNRGMNLLKHCNELSEILELTEWKNWVDIITIFYILELTKNLFLTLWSIFG